jgi:hypothetical protein
MAWFGFHPSFVSSFLVATVEPERLADLYESVLSTISFANGEDSVRGICLPRLISRIESVSKDRMEFKEQLLHVFNLFSLCRIGHVLQPSEFPDARRAWMPVQLFGMCIKVRVVTWSIDSAKRHNVLADALSRSDVDPNTVARLYHGTKHMFVTNIVKGIDLNAVSANQDFNNVRQGFYLNMDPVSAAEWAVKKILGFPPLGVKPNDLLPAIIEFSLPSDEFKSTKVPDNQWSSFVRFCRTDSTRALHALHRSQLMLDGCMCRNPAEARRGSAPIPHDHLYQYMVNDRIMVDLLNRSKKRVILFD